MAGGSFVAAALVVIVALAAPSAAYAHGLNVDDDPNRA